MLRGRSQGKKGRRRRPQWTERDRLLLLAFEMYLASLCSQCGNPRHRSMHPDMDGWYEVRQIVCHSCAAIESHRDSDAGRMPGAKPYAVDVRDPAEELPPWVPDLAGDDS